MRGHWVRISLGGVVAVMACVTGACADTKLKVNIFPGPQNLALFVAQDKGFFAKRGLTVEFMVTVNSQAQRDGLVNGAFEIAQAGVDNAVALVDVAKKDVVIVAGGSNGMNELMVRPEVKSYEDIRGKTLVVDAPNTAYALVLYKWLSLKGLKKGDYQVFPAGGCTQRLAAMKEDVNRAVALMNPPCNFLAEKAGFQNWGSTASVVGAYQADGVWVMRAWASANTDVLTNYIQGIIEGYRWAKKPENRTETASIVAKALKLEPEIATLSVEAAIGAKGGLANDAKFDMEGFKTTLQIRLETQGGDPNPRPEKYLDLSFYDRALAGLR